MKALRYISALLIACMCLAGCIRENIDDCETPVDLEFQYFGNGIVDIFPDRKASSARPWKSPRRSLPPDRAPTSG